MKYLLLTGATGLLGEYLLRDLTRLDRPIAVVARSSGRRSAERRIEEVFAKLERTEGRPLRRPVVLTGDLRQPRLGLTAEAERWVAESCDTLLHNAASLQFVEDTKTGEPYRSNVEGTRHMLELLAATGLRRLHHVSTAYVCGQRRGRVHERDPLDLATAGNDYERSKIESERLVRGFEGLDSLVVYRPAIIVGDHRTGYTSTYHGFYVPLQLCHSICMASPESRGLPHEMLLKALGLRGDECKNYVPVDWVSSVITQGVSDTRGRFDGQTLHLTPRDRVTITEMTEAIIAALAELPPSPRRAKAALSQDPEQLLAFFQEQMKVYEAYWRDDPEFDAETTDRLAPETPCPPINKTTMRRLCDYAIRTNFGSRRERYAGPVSWLGDPALGFCLDSSDGLAGSKGHSVVAVCVTGAGGGDCWFALSDRDCSKIHRGVAERPVLDLRMNRSTLDAMVAGDLPVVSAIRRGRVAALGQSEGPPDEEFVRQAISAFLGGLVNAGWEPLDTSSATNQPAAHGHRPHEPDQRAANSLEALV